MAGYVVATGAPSLSSPRGRPLCLGWWPLATGRRPGHRRDVCSTAFSGPRWRCWPAYLHLEHLLLL